MKLDEFAEAMFLLGRIDAKLDRIQAEIGETIQIADRILMHDAAVPRTLETIYPDTAQ